MRTEPSVYEVLNTNLCDIDPKRRFGKTARPIPATETYRRVISTLMRDGIRVERWILINTRSRTVTFAVTYNGITGEHFDAEQSTHGLQWDMLRPRIEAYQYVPTDECPIAEAATRAAVVPNRERMIA